MKKKDIPNIITAARIILSPAIVPVIWCGQIGIGIVLFIVTALTDLFDGLLARKWNAKSIEGKYLDTIADKEFAFLTLLSAVSLNPSLAICLGLELAISGINLKAFMNKYPTQSEQVGRRKTVFLSVLTGVTLFTPYLSNISSIISFLTPALIASTIGLQSASLISYAKNYKDNKEKEVNNENINEPVKLNANLSDQEVINHMKQFTFYKKSFDSNKQIKKLYRDYLIPEKMDNKDFNHSSNLEDIEVTNNQEKEKTKTKTKRK